MSADFLAISAALRASVLTVAACALAGPLAAWLAESRGWVRAGVWFALFAPLLTPALLVSYAYAPFALALLDAPFFAAVFYAFMLFLKLLPVAVFSRFLLPSPFPDEAKMIAAQAFDGFWPRSVFLLGGAGAGLWLGAVAVWLLAFSDFELASLWSLKTWTITLFDAQTGGASWAESWRILRLPLILEVAILGAVGILLRGLPRQSVPLRRPLTRLARGSLGAGLMLATLLLPIGPVLLLSARALGGWPRVYANAGLFSEIAVSLGFAFAATLLAVLSARWITRDLARRFVGIFPGLSGALLVSLGVLAIFQMPALHAFYDSPLPLILALAILLLPLAVTLRVLLRTRAEGAAGASVHTARLAGAREVLWALETRPRFLAASMLFCGAYLDFTAGSLLAPIGFTPVFVLLHNLMHYGQTAVLSAMLLASLAAPLALLLLTAAVVSHYARRDGA